MNMRVGKAALAALLGIAVSSGLLRPAAAEDNEIRIAKQTSIAYLQLYVMEKQKLIEKYATAAGVKDPSVSWLTFSGGNNINDALISGGVDVGVGGVPGLLTLWNRTKGTPREVRAIAAMQSSPLYMTTKKDNLHSIADLTEDDRISIPSLKVSTQAVMLQMAAARKWGPDQWGRLDHLLVVMTPADATVALLNGGAGITTVFSTPPFQEQQMKAPGVHPILNTFTDSMGGPHTSGIAWATSLFRTKNPRMFNAYIAASREATDIINHDKRAAAQLYIDLMQSSLSLDLVTEVVSGAQVTWTNSPEGILKIADFMKTTGAIDHQAKSWKDFFFPENHDLSGS